MKLLDIENLSSAATRCGISLSQFSKIIRGDIGVSPENLAKLVTGLSSDPVHQFQILKAHLYDEAAKANRQLAEQIRIEMDNATSPVGFSDLPANLQMHLRAIADRIQSGDRDLAGTIQWLAQSITALAALPLAAEEQAPYDVTRPAPHPDPLKQALLKRAAEGKTPKPPSAPQQTPPGSEK